MRRVSLGITDYLTITFLALIPPIILLTTIQEKLEEINFKKHWDSKVNKIALLLCGIWAVVGFILAILGVLGLFKGSDIYWLIVLIALITAIYFGIEAISLGVAKMIDRFSKEEE